MAILEVTSATFKCLCKLYQGFYKGCLYGDECWCSQNTVLYVMLITLRHYVREVALFMEPEL